MKEKLSQLFNVRPGEWGLALSLLLILALDTLVLELSDVVATAGFISQIGASEIPWLWIADMVVILLATGGYALVVDRVPRLRLVSWLLGGMALVYFLLQWLFVCGAPAWLTYSILYILVEQQFTVFPLAFWALANDVYGMAESKRLFPFIGAGYALGSIMGNGIAAGVASFVATWGVALGAVILLGGVVLLQWAFRKRTVRARQAREEGARVRETVLVGVDFFANVPLFGYLAVIILSGYVAYTIVQYHFLFTLDQVLTSAVQFQTFYGTYNVALIVATLLFQWLVAGRLLSKTSLKSTFWVFPVTLAVAVGSSLAIPGLVGGAAGFFLVLLMEQAWDEPVRKSVEGLVPDERRGRISAFLDSYLYALATIVGCLLLLILALSLTWLPRQGVTTISLGLAGLAAAIAVWAAMRLRSVYDESLLNWRLSRARRKSVLDGIEF